MLMTLLKFLFFEARAVADTFFYYYGIHDSLFYK
jgi:hypothetical protein